MAVRATFLLCCLLYFSTLALHAVEPDIVALGPKWTAKQFSGLTEVEAAVFKRTNDIRERHHLSPVQPDIALQTAARQHCQEMAEKQYFDHYSPVAAWRIPAQRTYFAGHWDRRVGENILKIENPAQNTASDLAGEFLRLWMASPSHRENILTDEWTSLGVAVYKKGDTIYSAQVFAAPLATLEHATLARESGQYLQVHFAGKTSSKEIKAWLDGRFQLSVTPVDGAFTTAIDLPPGQGKHEISISTGTDLAWTAQVDTDATAIDQLTTPHVYQTGVVTKTSVDFVPFTSFHLHATLQVPKDKTISLVRDKQVMDTLKPDEDHRVYIDMLLLPKTGTYTIGIAAGDLLSELLYIDVNKPITQAFLGRPE